MFTMWKPWNTYEWKYDEWSLYATEFTIIVFEKGDKEKCSILFTFIVHRSNTEVLFMEMFSQALWGLSDGDRSSAAHADEHPRPERCSWNVTALSTVTLVT